MVWKNVFSSGDGRVNGSSNHQMCPELMRLVKKLAQEPDGTKPLPEPILTYHQLLWYELTWKQFQVKAGAQAVALDNASQNYTLKLLPYLTGANELL